MEEVEEGRAKDRRQHKSNENPMLLQIVQATCHYNIQGAFFNFSHPKISKCQPVSKVRPILRTVPTLKKNKERKKFKYSNCSHSNNVLQLQYFDFYHT